MKKIIIILILLLGLTSTAYAGFWDFLFGADTPTGTSLRTFISSQVGESPTNGDVLQTDGSKSTWVAPSTLGIGGGTGSNWQYETNFGADVLTPTSTIPVWFKDKVHASSTIEADGSITTNTGFYGDYWLSSTGNSMAIQPTGDTDDFFSFKTPANRPTIKREGGKYIYIESTNIYDAGIAIRDGDTYSGLFAFEKDTNRMNISGKNSPLVIKLNSDYDDYFLLQTTSNTPELSVASSSAFKINAGGTNSLLLNHAGGNIGFGEQSPATLLEMSSASPYLTIHNTTHEDTDYGRESELIFKGEQSGGEETTLGKIQVAHDGTADDQKGIMSFKVNDGTEGDAPGTAMTILADGKVGIGTDSPGAKLEVRKDGSTTAIFRNDQAETNPNNTWPTFSMVNANTTSNNYTHFVFSDSVNGGSYFSGISNKFINHTNNYGDLGFWTRSAGGYTEKVTILSDGNIGIGTTDPDTLLHLSSTATTTAYYESSGAGFGGRTIYENEGAGACTETWAGSDGLLYTDAIACP